MRKTRTASIIFSIIISFMLSISGFNMKVSAADNLCHQPNHTYVWKLLSYDGKEHTFCWHCDTCDIDYVGAPGQEFDTRKTSRHYSASQTVTAVNDKYHQYSGTCDECHQQISYGEDHTFNDSGICTVCNYNKNNPSGNSGSGSSGGNGGSTSSSEGNSGNSGSENSGGGAESGGGNGGSSGGGSSQKSDDDSVTEDQIATIPTANDLTYNGKMQIGVPAGSGYTITNHEEKNAGTYQAKATLNAGYKWSDGTKGVKTIKWTIKKAKNPGKVKYNKTPTVKYSKLKNQNQKVKASKMFKIQGAVGKISYEKSSGNKNISVNKKTGELTVKKGLKKGTYKVKLKVTAAGDNNYKKGTLTVTVKVIVK